MFLFLGDSTPDFGRNDNGPFSWKMVFEKSLGHWPTVRLEFSISALELLLGSVL
ncbi:hypothetical protein [Thalassoglobus neptunius]|uniref:hypothetical protein n=1 Tax=Thalassoglobus neptunius TaxID=1938619 RepID=UPI0018D2115E|nr:hypothetical protein [Thalassoglobus neptunius]